MSVVGLPSGPRTPTSIKFIATLDATTASSLSKGAVISEGPREDSCQGIHEQENRPLAIMCLSLTGVARQHATVLPQLPLCG